ncbi:unnamed protein product, partial [Lampetra planeri]
RETGGIGQQPGSAVLTSPRGGGGGAPGSARCCLAEGGGGACGLGRQSGRQGG